MSKRTIEQEITQGRVLWIDNIHYDPDARRVVVKFVSDPESGIIDRKLIFANVRDYAESIKFETEPDCLDDLIALEEKPCGDFVSYLLVTGDKEVSLSGDPAPVIVWASASSSESEVEHSIRTSYSQRFGPDGKITWAHETGERIGPLKTDDNITGWIVALSLIAALVLSALLTAMGYPDIWLMEIVLVALLLAFMPSYRRRKRMKLGLCLKCGYDLRGSEDTCPECGTGFSN